MVYPDLSEEVLDKICPFFLGIDSQGICRSMGKSLKKVYPELKIGGRFNDFIEIVNPGAISDSELINQQSIMILKLNNRAEMRLKMMPIKINEDALIFFGHPYITDNFSFQHYNLTIADLAPQDAVLEYLFLHQAMKKSLSEAEEANQSLQKSALELRNALVKLQESNEESQLRAKYMQLILQANGNRELGKQMVGLIFEDCSLSFAGIYLFSPGRGNIFSHFITEKGIPLDKKDALSEELLGISVRLHDSIMADGEQIIQCRTYDTQIRAVPISRQSGMNDGWILMGRLEPVAPPLWKMNLINEVCQIMSVKITELRAERKMIDLNVSLQNEVERRTADLVGINKNLESFAYSVSHDLKAPIRHVSLAAGSLKKSLEEGKTAEASHYFELIDAATRKMSNLINALLHFSRIGTIGLNKVSFDAKNLIEDIVSGQKRLYPNHPITLNLSLHGEITGDKPLLTQVFENLISNAVKYSSQKPQSMISIYSRENSDSVEFTIADNGVGFDPSFENKLFLPFQRLHTAEQFEGTGIGLANVKRIIERHGGTIRAIGEPGKGAQFIFTISKN